VFGYYFYFLLYSHFSWTIKQGLIDIQDNDILGPWKRHYLKPIADMCCHARQGLLHLAGSSRWSLREIEVAGSCRGSNGF